MSARWGLQSVFSTSVLKQPNHDVICATVACVYAIPVADNTETTIEFAYG